MTLLASGGETQKPSSQLWNQSINEQLLEEIKRDADRFMLTPDPELTYSLFCVYGDTGERLAYERVYFERRKRLNSYVIMALQEPENVDYEVAALNMIWSVCNEFTWCLPAHFNEGSDRLDIDLFSAETGFALSEIKLLLGDRLPDLLRRRIEAEVENRLFRPFWSKARTGGRQRITIGRLYARVRLGQRHFISLMIRIDCRKCWNVCFIRLIVI